MVAPRALRSPISWVRSLTATSMILMTPIAPRASVTMPTAPRNMFITSKIVPTIFDSWIVSQLVEGVFVAGIEAVITGDDLVNIILCQQVLGGHASAGIR